MFRRLYWIVEQVATDGSSRVTGVYTSIQDLVGKGLNWSDGVAGRGLRLALVKPDTFDRPLGTWTGGTLAGIGADLQAYIQTHEFSEEEVSTLCAALSEFSA